MADTKFDIPTQLPERVARPLYAGVGVTDRVVEAVREAVSEVQKRALAVRKDVAKTLSDLDYQPQALRQQATDAVAAGVDALGKDAHARRRAVEERVAGLQHEAKDLPTRLQKLVDDQFGTAGTSYDDFVKRGETLVGRIRRQPSTTDTTSSAKTTTAKAKTTRTQATKTSKSTKKSTAGTAKKAATSPARSSAQTTATSAGTTAADATQAVADAAEKVGD